MAQGPSSIRKMNVMDAPTQAAPYRSIRELVSGSVLDAKGVTLRIVDIEPLRADTPRTPHAHATMEEVIFVLEGRGKVWVEGEVADVGPGDAVLIPAGLRHMTVNVSQDPLRLACFFPHRDAWHDLKVFPDIHYQDEGDDDERVRE